MEPNVEGQNNTNGQQQAQPNTQGQTSQEAPKPEHKDEKSTLEGLEGFFDTYLRIKAPFQFPPAAREWIVKYGPWISLVFLILGALVLIPLLVFALGLTAVSLPFAAATGSVQTTMFGWIGIVISLAVLVMQGIAIPQLMKRQLSGWKLIYYAQLLSAAGSIVSGSIVGAIIGLAIGMYVLFQIRSYYK